MTKKLLIDFTWIGSILLFAHLIMIEQSWLFTTFLLLTESVITAYLDDLTGNDN